MNQTQCIAAEASVVNREFNIVRVLFIILGIIVIVLLLHVIWSYKTNPLKLHTNIIVSFYEAKFSVVLFKLNGLTKIVKNI